MADFIGGPLTDGAGEQALGSDAFQSTTGEKFGADVGQAWDSLPTVRLLHQQQIYNEAGPAVTPTFPQDPRNAGSDIDEMEQERGDAPTRTTMQPGDATNLAKQAGAQGLSFDAPIDQTTAQHIIDDHVTAQKRAKVIENYQGGVLAKAASVGTGMLVGLADPLNLAAFAVPAVPEAFVAERLAAAAGVFGRTAIRAGAGAVNGAVGMTALEPLNYMLDQQEHNDWSAGEALRNIAFGAVMGGVGHAALGGLFGHDYVAPRDPDTAMAAFRAATGQVLDGRAVDVAGILDHANLLDEADRLGRPPEPSTLEPTDVAGAPADAASAPRVLDGDWLRKAGEVDGGYDMGKGGEALAAEAQAALARGDNVTLVADGGAKRIPITDASNGQLRDAQGAPWGSAWLAADKTGKEGLEITPDPQKAADARAQAAGAATDMANRASLEPKNPVTERATVDNKATVEQAPQVETDLDKQLAETQAMVNDLRSQVQTEITAGRMHPEIGKGELDAADALESYGKAAQAAASCLVSKGF